MNELSLFSGAGGGLLATQHLLGFNTIGYVEYDNYCQQVIAQRIKDGFLHNAPIFTDIRAFLDSGCAKLYQGITDLITAGFPCQPFSVAGQRKAEKDERNLWPEVHKTICQVRPRYVYLENVPSILSFDYIRRIYGDLAEAGYNAQWCELSAENCGAPHKRKRWWLVANSVCKRLASDSVQKAINHKECGGAWASITTNSTFNIAGNTFRELAFNLRTNDGVANRVDRIKAIGNGQVPKVVATAWGTLSLNIK